MDEKTNTEIQKRPWDYMWTTVPTPPVKLTKEEKRYNFIANFITYSIAIITFVLGIIGVVMIVSGSTIIGGIMIAPAAFIIIFGSILKKKNNFSY